MAFVSTNLRALGLWAGLGSLNSAMDTQGTAMDMLALTSGFLGGWKAGTPYTLDMKLL